MAHPTRTFNGALVFDLATLVAWCRRAASDRPVANRDEFSSDDTGTVVLNDDGTITLLSITVNGTAVPLTAVTLTNNVVAFTTPPEDGVSIVVSYSSTRYADADIINFLVDAAGQVIGDLDLNWRVTNDQNGALVDNIDARWYINRASQDLDMVFQSLFVYKAALDIMSDKGNQAADSAATVRDGDTAVDTSKMAAASEKAIARAQARYDNTFRAARTRYFHSQKYSDDGVIREGGPNVYYL